MFVWRKRASAAWLAANESKLRAIAGKQLAIIETATRKNAIAEIAGTGRSALERIRSRFGGKIEKLPHDWLKKLFSREQNSPPMKIGKRLVIRRSGGFQTAVGFESVDSKPSLLVIPARVAFGTGEHATTAMTLRFLEEMTRGWGAKRKWSMLDLGTGSGILALAAKIFGAGKVTAIDLDSIAISTAKENARANRIHGIDFGVADAHKFCSARKFQIVSANLYSEALIELMPRIARMLAKNGCAIFSGILRAQERAVMRALQRGRLQKKIVRRRGKWIAICTGQGKNLTA